jgi:PTH1 family peptidyl-tRNA hydrolase
MYLIVGLGNPGDEYAHTRHNAGFIAIDLLAKHLSGGREIYWKNEGGAQTFVCKRGENDIVLAKPQTFMNRSGSAVENLATLLGVAPSHIFVISDDLDLPAGSIRIRQGGGHGGHNGHRSIIEHLGTKEYPRVRIGIGRPPGRMDPADFVLQQLHHSGLEELNTSVEVAVEELLRQLDCGFEALTVK